MKVFLFLNKKIKCGKRYIFDFKLMKVKDIVNNKELINREKQYTLKFLRILVDSYIREINNKLELSSN